MPADGLITYSFTSSSLRESQAVLGLANICMLESTAYVPYRGNCLHVLQMQGPHALPHTHTQTRLSLSLSLTFFTVAIAYTYARKHALLATHTNTSHTLSRTSRREVARHGRDETRMRPLARSLFSCSLSMAPLSLSWYRLAGTWKQNRIK